MASFTREEYMNRILSKMADIKTLIELKNGIGLYDTNRFAEDYYAGLLNLIYGWHLENANDKYNNAPGIDLIDEKNHIVVQTSSTNTPAKIQHSIEACHKYPKSLKGYRFIMLIITEKQKHYRAEFNEDGFLKFDKEQDIWDNKTILNDLRSPQISTEVLKSVVNYMNDTISSEDTGDKKKSFGKWPLFWGFLVLGISGFLFWEVLSDNPAVPSYNEAAEYTETNITPIHNDVDMDSETSNKLAEKYLSEDMYNCFAFNTYLQNNTDKQLLLSENRLVISKITEIIEPRLYLTMNVDKDNHTLTLYAINNGTAGLTDCDIQLYISHSDTIFDNDEVEAFLGACSSMTIDLAGGEIRELATYRYHEEVLFDYFRADNPCFLLYFEVDDTTKQYTYGHKGLMIFQLASDGQYYAYFAQGDGGYEENISKIIVDVDQAEGTIIPCKNSIELECEKTTAIPYCIYPTRSCIISFYSSVKLAGEESYIESEEQTVKVYVPIYKEDANYFFSLREYLQSNDVKEFFPWFAKDPDSIETFINRYSPRPLDVPYTTESIFETEDIFESDVFTDE